LSGWIGNKKVFKAKEVHAKHPTRLVEYAVKHMLPKNKLSRELFRQLKIYTGSDHPHGVQNPTHFNGIDQQFFVP